MLCLIVLKVCFCCLCELNKLFDVKLNGNALPQHDKPLHLSTYVVACSNKANTCISKAISDVVHKVSALMTTCGFCDTDVLCNLLDTFCMSTYSSSLWRLNQVVLREVYGSLMQDIELG